MISRNQSWNRFGLVGRNGVKQTRVDPVHGRFRDSVDSVRLLPSHPNLDYAGIVLDEFAYGLPSYPPQTGKIADAVVLFEGRIVNQQRCHN